VLENTEKLSAPKEKTDLYIAPIGESAAAYARGLAMKLRAQGLCVETDIMERGIKAQMKYADRSGARFALVLGDEEINGGKARIKNMSDGSESECALTTIADMLKNA